MCRFTLITRKSSFLKWTFMSAILIMSFQLNSQCEISCKSSINISLDDACEATITPEMILTAPVADVTVYVIDNSGDTIPDNLVDLDYVGQQVTVSVVEGVCGNSCWGHANIEDKIAPVIDCPDMTIGCADLVVFMDPVPTSCDVSGFNILSRVNRDISCESTEFQQEITTVYEAFDQNGNISEPCTQVLTIEQFDLALIEIPMTTDTTLYCDAGFPVDENGNPRFDILGGPELSGVQLFPDQFIDCNTYLDYEDEVLQFNDCVTNVLRTWTVQNWFCGQDNIVNFNQFYTIVDTVGPVFATCPADMTVSTSGNSCEATFDLPELELSDACNEVTRIDVNFTGGFLMDGNGATINLMSGTNEVAYVAYDECGNSNICSFEVLVVDNAQPVTICDQFTTISLSTDGIALLSAEDIDDGSFDECGPVTLEIRRMSDTLCVEDDDLFQEKVTFCCADLGTMHMVALRVTDASLNSNICMATVEVQDKLPPVVLAGLPDITVSCTFSYDPNNLSVFGKLATSEEDRGPINLSSDSVAFDGPALDGLVIDNCTAVTNDEVTSESINQCGLGFVIRTITAENPEGQSVVVSQRIDFANNEPFIEDSIIWPLDYMPTSTCRPEDLDPDDLPAPYDRPTFNEDQCDMVGFTYEDQIVTNTPDGGGCFKIIRTWYVSDWCQDINNQFPVWTHEQYIEITNDIAPTIDSGTEDVSICVFDGECGPGFIELAVTGSDDCVDSMDLIWSYAIDLQSDNSIDMTGESNAVSGEFEVGTHTITWVLSDGCGNLDTEVQTFEIRNCKAPTPYCINGLSADLTPMDLNGDGVVDTEMLMLTPDFLDAGSAHVCGYEVVLSFSSDVNDTLRIFDCGDIGQQDIEIWVTDLVTGNQDFCSTYIIVQDNNTEDFCDTGALPIKITGRVSMGDEEGIEEVSVILEGTDKKALTDKEGRYEFSDLAQGMTFSVVPDYDVDPVNGVSTLDLILIQKHILGLEMIEDPYKLVAADINNSGSISASDLISLRKLILGKNEGFPNNKSWRFIDAEHQFIQPSNPWATTLPESYEIGVLEANMDIDFVGLKVGDVNSSVIMNGQADVATRSDNGMKVYAEDMVLKSGQMEVIEIRISEDIDLLGYQWALEVDSKLADIVSVNGISLGQDIEGVGLKNIEDGIITNNLFSARMSSLSENDVILSLAVIPFGDVRVSEILSINDKVLLAEVYDEVYEEKGIDLGFRSTTNGTKLYQNTPNPWSAETIIGFDLTMDQDATVIVYDITGKQVVQVRTQGVKGYNTVQLEKAQFTSNGIYYYELITGDFKAVRKMIISK